MNSMENSVVPTQDDLNIWAGYAKLLVEITSDLHNADYYETDQRFVELVKNIESAIQAISDYHNQFGVGVPYTDCK
jgi:hypothetical protein